MRPISRRPLNQQQATFFARAETAPCCGRGQWWSQREAAHNTARTPQAAEEAAAPALQLCASCPIVDACAEFAALAEYTGLAGGAVYFDGTRSPTHRLRNASISAVTSFLQQAG